MTDKKTPEPAQEKPAKPTVAPNKSDDEAPEVGGREGPDPTRFGDWEKNGRCIDF
jgi:hypothetical protein